MQLAKNSANLVAVDIHSIFEYSSKTILFTQKLKWQKDYAIIPIDTYFAAIEIPLQQIQCSVNNHGIY